MAKIKLTHIGKFFQEFSHPIPILTELMIGACSVMECAQQIVRVIFVTSDEEMARKYCIMIKDKGLPHGKRTAKSIKTTT